MSYKLTAVLLAFAVAGCAGPKPACPPAPVITIVETVRIPVPLWLTEPCVVECEIVTNGDLLTCYQDQRRALAECNRRMGEIRGLD